MINNFLPKSTEPARVAMFMSGSGSNVERLLEDIERSPQPRAWSPAVIVTDNPLKSRAGAIAERWSIPLLNHDIREFYQQRGETRISLATERGREIRGEWTGELREMLARFSIDFGVLAGFVPLTNITSDFPCLNVHPGDLTVTSEDGRRILVGLHTIPIEIAILKGLSHLRSSVIIAQTYTGAGGEMDTGPILGVSKPVPIDLSGKTVAELSLIANSRPSKRPRGGFDDELERIAKHNQETLKQEGDWSVFPPVVADFAAGRFAMNDENDSMLFLDENNEWRTAQTVEYAKNGMRTVIRPHSAR